VISPNPCRPAFQGASDFFADLLDDALEISLVNFAVTTEQPPISLRSSFTYEIHARCEMFKSRAIMSLMLRSARIIAWVLVFILTLLSVVPPWLRPTTNVSHNVEHFAALFVTGVAFGLGYSRRPVIVGLVLVFFCAAIEIVQLLVPGRHARLSDFIVDAVAATAGVAAAFVGGRAAKGSRYRR
jgi:VanZ family protein